MRGSIQVPSTATSGFNVFATWHDRVSVISGLVNFINANLWTVSGLKASGLRIDWERLGSDLFIAYASWWQF